MEQGKNMETRGKSEPQTVQITSTLVFLSYFLWMYKKKKSFSYL